jgi:murein DD-endopeptidase MepM/ murein hydrolase activator NlpD
LRKCGVWRQAYEAADAEVANLMRRRAYLRRAAGRQYEAQARSRYSSRSYSSVQRQKRNIEAKLRGLRKQQASVQDQMKDLDSRSAQLDTNLLQVTHDLHVMQEQLATAKDKLEELENELARRKALVAERVDSVYMQGELTYLDLLFNAENFREFINRAFYLNLIFEKDQELFQSVKDKKTQVEEEKQKLEFSVTAIANAHQKLKDQQAEVANVRKEKAALLRVISRDKALTEQQYQEILAESRRIGQFLRSTSGYSGKWTGRFLQPVPGRIGSGFGMRLHPIAHVYRMHTGVDIGAPYGTPIRAGGDGKVVSAGWRGGYGNAIIVDHGGGVATLYAHCSRFAVSVGEIVKAGQTIAYVGSTGYSTGPHVHFEVRVHGEPVNPLGKM